MKLATERKLVFFLFLLIPILCFAIFIIYPIIESVRLSFHRWDGISPDMTYVGLENYQKLFSHPRFRIALMNNIKWLVFSLLLPPFLVLGVSLLIDQKIRCE